MAEKAKRIATAEDLRQDWIQRGRPRSVLGLLFEIAEKSRSNPGWAVENAELIRQTIDLPELRRLANTMVQGEKSHSDELKRIAAMVVPDVIIQQMQRLTAELREVTAAALGKQLDLLQHMAGAEALAKIKANQPDMVSDLRECAKLKKMTGEGKAAEVRKILAHRAEEINKYWRGHLGLTPGRRGRHPIPLDRSKPFLCAILVQNSLRRLRWVYHKKQEIKQDLWKAIKRNPSLLLRKLLAAGCTGEEAEVTVRCNSPLRAACELVAKTVGVDADSVGRYYRTHRKELLLRPLSSSAAKPNGSR